MADVTERQTLAEITAERGWSRRIAERTFGESRNGLPLVQYPR